MHCLYLLLLFIVCIAGEVIWISNGLLPQLRDTQLDPMNVAIASRYGVDACT